MKRPLYVLTSGLMMFAACGNNEKNEQTISKVYNVKSLVCTTINAETGVKVEAMKLTYDYDGIKMAKAHIDLVNLVSEGLDFQCVSETETTVTATITWPVQQTAIATFYFDSVSHALTKREAGTEAGKFLAIYAYNDKAQMISENLSIGESSKNIAYTWQNDNLTGIPGTTLMFSDKKNNTNFDFAKLWIFLGKFLRGTEDLDGLYVTQLIGGVSANIPSSITNEYITNCPIQTTFDDKERPVTMMLDNATLAITYYEE